MASNTTSLLYPQIQAEQPGLCGLAIFAGDIAAVAVSIMLAVGMRTLLGPATELAPHWHTLPVIGVFAAVYALFGLYPGIALNAVAEMRKLTTATTLVFVLLATGLFLLKEGNTYSRFVFVMAWALALVLVPVVRTQVRAVFGKRAWWGFPVAVFAATDEAHDITAGLRKRPHTGLLPAVIYSHDHDGPSHTAGVPVFATYEHAATAAQQLRLQHAIIATSQLPARHMSRLLETGGGNFSKFYVMPGLDGYSSESVEARQIGDTLTLEIRRNLLLPSCQLTKGLIDRCISFLLLLLLAPLFALVAIAIRLESRGAALFQHRRVGLGGREFGVWKFRSMHPDGDAILARHFAAHPEDEEVWRSERKLRNDPRVTRLGRLLRKTSLDELPQLWNVLRGDMSLVGPRPIVRDEIDKYGEQFHMYCRVMPGLTGLWQVSGRSETNYQQRVDLDAYYVRNWSPWFDIYLLFSTFRVVIKCEGAY